MPMNDSTVTSRRVFERVRHQNGKVEVMMATEGEFTDKVDSGFRALSSKTCNAELPLDAEAVWKMLGEHGWTLRAMRTRLSESGEAGDLFIMDRLFGDIE